MTNSFFQMWVLMGLQNSLAIHQHQVTATLRELLGCICHIYLDDIIICSNPKKCEFLLLELEFLGHHISVRGIEASILKVNKVLNWPVPWNTTEVCSFLRLVRYIVWYLPKLVDHTVILTPLTTKSAQKKFPLWTDKHQEAFDTIKSLVMSQECLTVIDHGNMGENHVFLTCDASDWHTSTTLSFGPTWEKACPVAFDLMQLKGTEKNYLVHKKELLAIICALKKWQSDLLSIPIII